MAGMHFSISVSLPMMSSRAAAIGAVGVTEAGGGYGRVRCDEVNFHLCPTIFNLLRGLAGAEKLFYLPHCLLN